MFEKWTYIGNIPGVVQAAYEAGKRGDELSELIVDVKGAKCTLHGFTGKEIQE